MIFVDYSWIMKILFMKISSESAWFVDEEVSVLSTKNSLILGNS